MAANHRMLTEPRLHPDRCRLFRRAHALVVAVDGVAAVADVADDTAVTWINSTETRLVRITPALLKTPNCPASLADEQPAPLSAAGGGATVSR